MRSQVSLNGRWRCEPLAWLMLEADGTETTLDRPLPQCEEMDIPGNWHYSGMSDFFGRARFTRHFTAAPQAGRRAFLRFDGVDYACEVRLNGHLAGKHEGCFQTFEFDVTPWLRADGEQELSVVVSSPNERPGPVWPHRKRLVKGILSHWDGKQGSWDPEHGQDGNTGGIWGGVTLEWRAQSFLQSVSLHTQLLPKISKDATSLVGWDSADEVDDRQKAWVWVTAQAQDIPAGVQAQVRLTLTDDEGRAQAQTVAVAEGRAQALFVLTDPKLWWTWDLGAQSLYQVKAELLLDGAVVDVHTHETGVCEISVDSATGTWSVNGKRLFIRGTNVIPSLWLAHYGQDRIERDIALLKGAGVNAVRVCVHVSNRAFYDACDRAGILIWQDFLLQWGYANEDSVVYSAVTQIKDMVRGLRRHPSIAVWCCQNESMFFNNEIVGPQLARAAREEDASRYVHPVSHFNEHPYPGWYFGSPEEFKALPGGRMITEFGAQALPSLPESIALNGGDFWPPDWDRLAFHDFQYDQTFFVAKVDRGDNWETFVNNSQRYQAALLKTAIESFRKSRFQKVGSYFQFMFMDCWPSITWSVVSYDRVPKLGYRTLQQSNQPVLAGVSLGRTSFYRRVQKGGGDSTIHISPWIINDLHRRFEGCELSVELIHGETGGRAGLNSSTVTLEPDSLLELGPIAVHYDDRFAPGKYELVLRVTHEGQVLNENSYDVEFGE